MARVLIADNCHDTAESLAILLRLWGHETRVVADGPSVLEAARTYRPDVILTDVVLRLLDGYSVARRLRRMQGTRSRLVAITGFGRDKDRQQSHDAGFDLHLVKPVDPEMIRRLLDVCSAEVEEAECAAGEETLDSSPDTHRCYLQSLALCHN